MSLLRGGFRRTTPDEARFGVDEYAELVNQFAYNGLSYGLSGSGGIQQTLAGEPAEKIGVDYVGLAQSAYASNGVVFACMLARQMVFSGVRFRWQKLANGRPSATFGGPELGLLEQPWTGGTTQDLLSRLIQDADLAGNSYWAKNGNELVRLRPDWVEIVARKRVINGGQVGWSRLGYLYSEGGPGAGNEPVPFLADEVAHFAPLPDPLATFRGMSWLTPIVREVQADRLMTRHKRKYLENGSTPNLVVRHGDGATPEKAQRFAEMLDEKHRGVDNAYKTLHLYPGADVTLVGNSLQQMDFKTVQGAGETRIAAASGVPPVIVGLSEGLSSATYSNYGQARRRFADGTIHPLWMNAAGTLSVLLRNTNAGSQPGVRLWYDTSDVPFLREDEKDAAEIAGTQAATINSLVNSGFTAESAIAAIQARDWALLTHSGLVSVQLQPPGVSPDAAAPTPTTGDTNA